MRIEQARRHQPQCMHRGLVAERPDRTEQPRMAFVDLGVARQRIAWMQIERYVEFFRHGPERPVLRQVVVSRRLGIADLREAVNERAAEAELFYAALQLARRAVGI